MRRAIGIGLLAGVLAGCGSGGLRGSLEWRDPPTIVRDHAGHARVATGYVRNTTSHAVDLDPAGMRLLDASGRKVDGRIRVGTTRLAAHATTSLRARWRAGKPVRIDYGAGTLRLTSG